MPGNVGVMSIMATRIVLYSLRQKAENHNHHKRQLEYHMEEWTGSKRYLPCAVSCKQHFNIIEIEM